MNKENKSEDIQESPLIEKEETCKIINIMPTKISVYFKGFGIEIPISEDIEIQSNLKEIKVFYTSDIGQPDFRYYLRVEE